MSEHEADMDALREELQGLRERQAQADCAEVEGRVVDRGQWLDSMRARQQRIEELIERLGERTTIEYPQARPFAVEGMEPFHLKDCSSHRLLDETNPQPEGDPCPPSSPTV